jgi:hypothetical protein
VKWKKTDTSYGLFDDTDTNSSLKFGLIINQGKAKYMRNTRKETKRKEISIDNMTFEHVSSFKYLESIVNETHKIQQEIESRISAGNRAYHANKKLLTNKLLSKNTKMSVYKTIIRPVVTYGSETWMMNITHEKYIWTSTRFKQ